MEYYIETELNLSNFNKHELIRINNEYKDLTNELELLKIKNIKLEKENKLKLKC